ncbi:HAD family hydrolase [Gracilibacillus xinjiangensis]|uniref:HAD family hydrolase n=1 Tax=Gracilibacillus xinjiangensis TaxID=1193282 RepID=A0ABV8WYU6_9BACI
MIKAVMFDFDGTLLNRDASVRKFISNQYDRLLDCFIHVPKINYINRFIELENRGYVWKDKVFHQLVEELKITNLTWQELLEDYIEYFQCCCVPFPHLTETLDTLKSKKIKYGRTVFQKRNIDALKISHYFDQIIISEAAGIKKPDPQIFKLALDHLQVMPSESIYVGDHPVNDIEAAQGYGLIGIWKKDNYWGNPDTDYVIEDLCEIIDIMKEKETFE